jgi:DNA polymerase V
MVVPMVKPTDDTMHLTGAALKGLAVIYRDGFRYKKAGILLMGLEDKDALQATLFDDLLAEAKSARLMLAMDAINARMGSDTVSSAAAGIHKRWRMRRERKSPDYTTDWKALPLVMALR